MKCTIQIWDDQERSFDSLRESTGFTAPENSKPFPPRNAANWRIYDVEHQKDLGVGKSPLMLNLNYIPLKAAMH
jgi:hypothetical protein